VFFLLQPNQDQVRAYTESQVNAEFNYTELGQTRDTQCPAGYNRDYHQIELGSGAGNFACAREALQNWQIFKNSWLHLCNPTISLEVGTTLIVQVKHLGFYSLIADRVVYIIDEPRAFGFAYGTLMGHAAQGEERFLIEWLEDDRVIFSLFAFSKPGHPLAILGKPIMRWLQQQGSSKYLQALKQVVQESSKHL
jgi:uncharacterized protein (UPF0548 family)